ncbi:YggS family pyridoxal phosphate-dependent enzyme [Endozoicomonas sp. 4G]|uniref:YggS family pyridoxal phosphate-dependent enzyme n=1 Tax=Endozoicomonas sp. 4G TaxID=2872754 RepID=UPI002078DC06|nr:YggS family pyridoxal phosphate-dependent enzyme [Endozoicomonas sp. 4G]
MTSLNSQFDQVFARIHKAEQASDREGQVKLLAVSKTKPANMIAEAWQLGQRDFGENYVQEAVDKITQLSRLKGLVWHFIGPIQSNKTRDIASHFHWVHSVDRFKIAQRLNDQRPEKLPPLNICLQVNISQEESKSGVTLAELPELAVAVSQLPRLRLRGLMAIPAPQAEQSKQRAPFKKVADALESINREHHLTMDTLSMGMTGDLEAAIAEGATMVRIGTALFGARSHKE